MGRGVFAIPTITQSVLFILFHFQGFREPLYGLQAETWSEELQIGFGLQYPALNGQHRHTYRQPVLWGPLVKHQCGYRNPCRKDAGFPPVS